MRVGVGRPEEKEKITNFVLSKFLPDELIIVQGVLEKVTNDLEKIIG